MRDVTVKAKEGSVTDTNILPVYTAPKECNFSIYKDSPLITFMY